MGSTARSLPWRSAAVWQRIEHVRSQHHSDGYRRRGAYHASRPSTTNGRNPGHFKQVGGYGLDAHAEALDPTGTAERCLSVTPGAAA